jgi:hypothetical protein
MDQPKPRSGRALRGGLYAVGVLGALALSYYAYLRYAPRDTPEGQPGLVSVTRESFAALRERFNAAADKTRVLVMLSPT